MPSSSICCAQLLAEVAHRDQVLAFLAVGVADVGDRVAEEVGDGHAGDRRRVLERQEEARLGPLVGLQREEVLAVERGRALGHLVVRVAHQGVAQGALARAVRAHQGVDLALAEREVDPLEDLLAVDGDVQVVDRKNLAHQSDVLVGTLKLAKESAWPRSRRAVAVEPALAEPQAAPSTFSNIFRSSAQTARSALGQLVVGAGMLLQDRDRDPHRCATSASIPRSCRGAELTSRPSHSSPVTWTGTARPGGR